MSAEIPDSEPTPEELLEAGKTGEYLLQCGITQEAIDDFAEICFDEVERVRALQEFFANEIYDGRYLTIMYFVKALGKMFGADFQKKFEYDVYLSYEATFSPDNNDEVARRTIEDFCNTNGIRYQM